MSCRVFLLYKDSIFVCILNENGVLFQNKYACCSAFVFLCIICLILGRFYEKKSHLPDWLAFLDYMGNMFIFKEIWEFMQVVIKNCTFAMCSLMHGG